MSLLNSETTPLTPPIEIQPTESLPSKLRSTAGEAMRLLGRLRTKLQVRGNENPVIEEALTEIGRDQYKLSREYVQARHEIAPTNPDREQGIEPLPPQAEKTALAIPDLFPEIPLNNENDLRAFLEQYRESLMQVGEELHWGVTRCAFTSAVIMRALHPKANVVGLQWVDIDRRLSSFFASVKSIEKEVAQETALAHQLMKESVEHTEKSPKFVGEVLRRFDSFFSKNRSEWPSESDRDRFVQRFDPTDQEAVTHIVTQLHALSGTPQIDLKRLVNYFSSGWGHTVVGLDILYPGHVKPTRYIIDANSEQYGSAFDQLYLFPIEEALDHGYILDESPPEAMGKLDAKSISNMCELEDPHSTDIAVASQMIADRFKTSHPKNTTRLFQDPGS